MPRNSRSATMPEPPSLIFEDGRPPEIPGVHAVVVGVGHYRHLPGGSGARYADHEGMVQLSSPPHSAQHIAKWLFDTYHDDQALPLRSVHMLVSKKGGAADFSHQHCPAVTVPQATHADVETAVLDWFDRGDGSSENLMLFYFCGHGISAGDQHTLLCTDFGKNRLNPFKGAIDFTDFHLGMGQSKADSQIFFVDACRTISHNLLEQASFRGEPMIPGNLTLVPRRAPVFRSAQPGEKAFGLPGKPSAFAQALALAFKGGAWDKVDGDWVVCTSMLRRALERQIKRVMRAFPTYQADVAGDAEATMTIKYPAGAPVVPVDLGGRPDTDHSLLELAYEAAGGGQVVKEANDDDIWLLDLAEGQYQFSAKFESTAGDEKVATLDKYVSPQNVSERLRVP